MDALHCLELDFTFNVKDNIHRLTFEVPTYIFYIKKV